MAGYVCIWELLLEKKIHGINSKLARMDKIMGKDGDGHNHVFEPF